MYKAAVALDQTLRKDFGRCCFDPDGQDGVSCLLLAVIDQLHDLNLNAGSMSNVGMAADDVYAGRWRPQPRAGHTQRVACVSLRRPIHVFEWA